MSKTVRETIDISDQFSTGLHIEKAIDLLKGLSAEHPDAFIQLTHEYAYGDHTEKLYLNYDRPKVAIELELDALSHKCRQLQALKAEAAAFKRNGTPYPRREEALALAAELGVLALAPQFGSLGIYEGQIVVQDMMRGMRRRDGEWIMRMMRGFEHSDNPEIRKSAEHLAEMEKERERLALDVSWIE